MIRCLTLVGCLAAAEQHGWAGGWSKPPIPGSAVADFFANRAVEPAAEAPPEESQPILDAAVQQNELRGIVRDLGAASFAVRERASVRLGEIDAERLPAIEALSEQSADPEVRQRVSAVVEKRERQAEAKLRARFLSGSDVPMEGFDTYRELLGDGVRLREIFLEMRQRHPEVLRAIDAPAPVRNDAIRTAAVKIGTRRSEGGHSPDETDTMALLLLAGDPAVPLSPVDEGNIMMMLRWSSANVLREDAQLRPPFETLAGAWMRRCGPFQLANAFFLAMQWNLSDPLPVARELIARPDSDAEMMSIAHQYLSRFGEPSDIELLRANLDDPRMSIEPTIGAGGLSTVQVGDTAAAAITIISDRPLSAIGMPDVAEHPAVGFDINAIGFDSDEKRSASRQQLREILGDE